MVSAQDIRDVKFSKSLGGYKTAEVDAFLDDCAETVASLAQTNEENERKMQVLAESIVEYRNREDSIRTALVSAQKMSDAVINEANGKAEEIIAQAHEEAAQLKEIAEKEIADEKAELARIKGEVAAFKSRLMAVYREHLTLIGVLEGEEEKPAEEQPKTEEEASAPAQPPIAAPVEPVDELPVVVSADVQDGHTFDKAGLDFSSLQLKEDE